MVRSGGWWGPVNARFTACGVMIGAWAWRGRRLAETVSLLATTAVFALIVFYGARFAYAQWELEETSPGLGHPTWIYTVWLPLLAAVILFRTGQRAVRVWRARR